ncbi:sucrase/ferredoxin-like family protein [Leishmania donovani]|uniref:Sucrase/ferredoxin-like_putative/Pfam:PF06999 n=2 Tax=Leishmania donovani TaxID=5661 RepID=A0A6J8FR01_LEIDO|nr:sucrase/ferredoxin-like family protein [Leishmania donovani]VDZ49840.1 Sucrase/ferredoxin-like_putative/Pfam:PF06999 [Leishmania donovani]
MCVVHALTFTQTVCVMSTDPNSFEAIRPKLTAQTLQDIEGLDPQKYGFGREECCGPIPAKIIGSMSLREHIFLNTRMPAREWDKRTENVPGFKELSHHIKHKLPDASFTVSHRDQDTEDSILHCKVDDKKAVIITQYSGVSVPYELPWEVKGTLAVDRSGEYFIFVCSHFTRDARCGYCGSVLIDLFRHALLEKMGAGGAERVTVYSCSHIGGHIYAGNVIIYSRHGGICYGLFKPEDVLPVVDAIAEDKGAIPESLKNRIRGQMGSDAS